MLPKTAKLLWDIETAAGFILRRTDAMSLQTYLADELLRLAVE